MDEGKWQWKEYEIRCFYIQNLDIRGRFLVCSWRPSAPKSLLPLEYTFPATRNNVCTGPHEIYSTFDASDQSNSRGVNT